MPTDADTKGLRRAIEEAWSWGDLHQAAIEVADALDKARAERDALNGVASDGHLITLARYQKEARTSVMDALTTLESASKNGMALVIMERDALAERLREAHVKNCSCDGVSSDDPCCIALRQMAEKEDKR